MMSSAVFVDWISQSHTWSYFTAGDVKNVTPKKEQQ